jgi:hypothetical protein
MASEEALVISANHAFYAAFARGDLAALEGLWARRAPVACIHPGWDALHGREEVMASFGAILSGGGAPRVRCTRTTASVLGESAYVVCGEAVDGAELIATNVFVREDGAWKLVHHQAGPVHRRVVRDGGSAQKPRSGMLN